MGTGVGVGAEQYGGEPYQPEGHGVAVGRGVGEGVGVGVGLAVGTGEGVGVGLGGGLMQALKVDRPDDAARVAASGHVICGANSDCAVPALPITLTDRAKLRAPASGSPGASPTRERVIARGSLAASRGSIAREPARNLGRL